LDPPPLAPSPVPTPTVPPVLPFLKNIYGYTVIYECASIAYVDALSGVKILSPDAP